MDIYCILAYDKLNQIHYIVATVSKYNDAIKLKQKFSNKSTLCQIITKKLDDKRYFE